MNLPKFLCDNPSCSAHLKDRRSILLQEPRDRDLTEDDLTELRSRKEQEVTWQHEETGALFTKLIPVGESIPEIPRRFIVSVRDLAHLQ